MLLAFWRLLTFLRAYFELFKGLPVDRVEKRNCYLLVSTLTSKNISGILFVVSLSLNMFFLPFSGTLTWTYINHTYLLVVYTLNTTSTPYFFVYNRWKRKIPFMRFFGLQYVNSIFFLTLKLRNMLGGTLFVVFQLVNTLFLLFFAISFVIALVAPILLHFNLKKHHSYCAFSFVAIVDVVCCLFWSF